MNLDSLYSFPTRSENNLKEENKLLSKDKNDRDFILNKVIIN